jgi:hypothetical protein
MGTGDFGLGGRPRLPIPLVLNCSPGETGRSSAVAGEGDVYRDLDDDVDTH